MNKRRRFKAKRRKLIERLRDRYNRPWLYTAGGMYYVRRAAGERLRAMRAPDAPSWP